MEPRRNLWKAAIELAVMWSTVAAAGAAVLHSVDVGSQASIVLGVIVIGFVASWVRTGRTEHTTDQLGRHTVAHRVVTVPVSGVHHHPVS